MTDSPINQPPKLSIQSSLHNQEVISKFGNLEEKKYIAVIDLELTCWDDTDEKKQPREKSEIIEIGIVILDKNFNILEEISSVCKPMYYPALTEYCTNLTGITQEEINNSRNLCVEFSILEDKYPVLQNKKELIWAAWGNDVKWLQTELNNKIYKDSNKRFFDPRVINVAAISKKLGFGAGLKKCMNKLQLEMDIPVHRALPDAKSTAKVLKQFKLTPLDAMISNERSYSEALKKKKAQTVTALLTKVGLKVQSQEDALKIEKLLNYVNWDFQKALNIYRLFSNTENR